MDEPTRKERTGIRSVRVIGSVARPSAVEKAAQREEAQRSTHRQKLLRNYDREVPDETESAASAFDQSAVTCCIRGRATRQIPCRNSNFRGCPYRESENGLARGGRERTRGYEC